MAGVPPPERQGLDRAQAVPPAEERFAREFDPRLLGRYMEIEGIQGNRVTGRILAPASGSIRGINALLREYGLVAFIGKSGEGHTLTYAYAPPRGRVKVWLHALLLGATVLTTLFVGALHAGVDPFARPLAILAGWPFALCIIAVLGSHELAHYLAARRLGVDATPPYFLPVPHPLTGTMGAFIRIRSPVPSRSALVRVGVAGPLVGFLVCLPVTVVGLVLSRAEVVAGRDVLALGTPPLFALLSGLIHGPLAAGQDVMLHPVALAGWLGMFVTALNLLPVGQLDGGHIAYALLGRHYRKFTLAMLGVLLAGGLLWPGWAFWALLIAVFGLRHPPPLDDVTPLGRADVALAVAGLVVFALTFIPVPFPASGF
jgi:membrane-associated protease RseP (regulator of RpoE activity)